MNQVISSVAAQLNADKQVGGRDGDLSSGLVWKRTPDEYDQEVNVVWQGEWVLAKPTKRCHSGGGITKTKAQPRNCGWKCPNGHMDDHYCYRGYGGFAVYQKKVIECQKKNVANNLNPDHYTCDHDTHEVCSGSLCCDLFWHAGECHFISADGGCGNAVRFGEP